jgi:hypothetical protein
VFGGNPGADMRAPNFLMPLFFVLQKFASSGGAEEPTSDWFDIHLPWVPALWEVVRHGNARGRWCIGGG